MLDICQLLSHDKQQNIITYKSLAAFTDTVRVKTPDTYETNRRTDWNDTASYRTAAK